jgi:hypothetical protein
MQIGQSLPSRNALIPPSPQRRARICEAIGRELALEYFRRTNAKREARARLAIGLRPFPRTIHWERCQ